jgi:hypothetical protein
MLLLAFGAESDGTLSYPMTELGLDHGAETQ